MMLETGHDPYIISLGDDMDDIYTVRLVRDALHDLTLSLQRKRGTQIARLLEVAAKAGVKPRSKIQNDSDLIVSDVVLHVNTGSISPKDKAVIHFLTHSRKIPTSYLGVALPTTLTKEYTKAKVLTFLAQKQLKKDIAQQKTFAYIQSAYNDIEEAARGIIPAVDAKLPPQYHRVHFEYEQRVFTEPHLHLLPPELKLPKYENKPLLKVHMKAHQFAFQKEPWLEK